MAPVTDRTQPFRAAKLGSIAYSHPAIHGSFTNHPSWNSSDSPKPASTFLQDCHRDSHPPFSNTTSTPKHQPKRKTKASPLAQPTTKKQKLSSEDQRISDESFRTAQTPHFGVIQPIGILAGQIPLSNVERWRLRGWRWPEAMMRWGGDECVEVESPMGEVMGGRGDGVYCKLG